MDQGRVKSSSELLCRSSQSYRPRKPGLKVRSRFLVLKSLLTTKLPPAESCIFQWDLESAGGPSGDCGVEGETDIGWATKQGDNRNSSCAWWLVPDYNYCMKRKPFVGENMASSWSPVYLRLSLSKGKEKKKKIKRKKLKEAILNFKQGLNVIERKSEQLRNAQGLERRLGWRHCGVFHICLLYF